MKIIVYQLSIQLRRFCYRSSLDLSQFFSSEVILSKRNVNSCYFSAWADRWPIQDLVSEVHLMVVSIKGGKESVTKETLYRVAFVSRGQIYEVYARQLFQSELYGFIEVEEFVFGSRAQVVVDPSEEKLKAEFEGVSRSYIPINAVLRIDEVEKAGTPKISQADSIVAKVAQFPTMPPRTP